jgi:hypothetical protein
LFEWGGVSSSYGKNPASEEIKEITSRLDGSDLDDLLQYARLRLKIKEDRLPYRTGENHEKK